MEGFTGADARAATERTRALCDVVEDPDRLAFNLWGLASMHQTRGEMDAATELGERLCAHGQASGERLHHFMGHQMLGNVLVCCGEASALEHLEQALVAYDASFSPLLITGIGQDVASSRASTARGCCGSAVRSTPPERRAEPRSRPRGSWGTP